MISAEPQHSIDFSEKDRNDAARLLTLILGGGHANGAIRDRDAIPIARAILEDRKRRAQFFNPGMFGEPGWDLLLNLYVFDRDGRCLTIGKLTKLAGVSQSTSLRWLEYLTDQKLIIREQHPTDARTAYVVLTDKAREALGSYLSQMLTPQL
jgi:DNA-binding MarR family transcriptional regulator